MNTTELCGDLPKPQASIWERGRMMWFQFHTICPQISFTTRLVTDFGGESKGQGSGLLCISWRSQQPCEPHSFHGEVDRDCCLPLKEVLKGLMKAMLSLQELTLCLSGWERDVRLLHGQERKHRQPREKEKICWHSQQGAFFIFFKKPVVLIYFGCAGSLLLHWLSLVVVSKGYSLLWCVGFSPWWLLLLQSMGSRASGLQ